MIKVAHLVPTLHPGGPQTGLVDLAAAASAAGLELMVVALASTSDTTQVGALRRLGVPVAELGLAPWDPRAAARVARALRTRGAQLVHTHLPQADVAGAAAALRLRVPAVSTLHRIENEPADRVDRLRRTARILARQRFMSRTIAISTTQREWYRGIAGPKGDIVVVPDGVVDPGDADPETRERLRTALAIGPADALALSLEPMRRGGGHELLLDAVETVPESAPLVVALAGDGPLRPWLESRVAATEALRDRVVFLARHHDHAELLGAADLVVHTSASGAQPTTLLRAMAAGRPVVATRVGGVPEIVSAATGVLTALRPDPIGDALRSLATDPVRRERLGAAARRRFLTDFEATGWARRLRAVYEEVLPS
ncbi:glycosyltransferase family 4 protein [Pseudonocardia sp.]|uniref:glycosyltransferase family 4 protein n=1 Tax=Pseudonocardia sp. TaxID=60912 RepID=UPI00263402F1|nr:glycosyltransferase family 4 protein [Pseudonocardia sp.]